MEVKRIETSDENPLDLPVKCIMEVLTEWFLVNTAIKKTQLLQVAMFCFELVFHATTFN